MANTSANEDKLKALDAALSQIEKQFGKGSVMKRSGRYPERTYRGDLRPRVQR